ncbi:MAG: MFS transporter, partial [Actinomycetota bacterium]|nr:MFS transporter [Actinomycetota bacterium]
MGLPLSPRRRRWPPAGRAAARPAGGRCRATGATQTQALWIVNAYSLVFAALLLPAAALADIIGRRRAFVGGLVLFGGFSAATALATDPNLLIVLRGLAGVGAALVMPVSLTIVTASFSKEETGRAVGIWSGVAGGAGTLGLIIAGGLLEGFDWTSIFWLSAAVTAVALAATFRWVPGRRTARRPGRARRRERPERPGGRRVACGRPGAGCRPLNQRASAPRGGGGG